MTQSDNCVLDNGVRSLFDIDLALIGDYSRDCGLLFPGDDLDAAIRGIIHASHFDGCWDDKALEDIASYYLFLPAIVAMQFREFAPDYYPFRYWADCLSDIITASDPTGMKVLHAACACEETALAGCEMVKALLGQDHIASYDIVDLCSITINRISRFAELTSFAQGINFHATVGRIEDIPSGSAYDLILTDRLLGGSPQEEYDIGILRNFKRVLRDGGMLVTAVEAMAHAVLSDQPNPPGELCHEYFCRRYGSMSDGRDAKVGLTREQWHDLSERYHRVMANTYFSVQRQWRIRSAGDVIRLLRSAGFGTFDIRRIHFGDPVTWEDIQLRTANVEEMEGSLIVYATK